MLVLVEGTIGFVELKENFPLEIMARALRSCISQILPLRPEVLTQVEISSEFSSKEDYAFFRLTSESSDTESLSKAVEMAVRPFMPKTTIHVVVITVAQLQHRSFKP